MEGACSEDELPVEHSRYVLHEVVAVSVEVGFTFKPHLIDAFDRAIPIFLDGFWL